MANVCGNFLSIGGGGGQNADLPPLLDNFKAESLIGHLEPPTQNTLEFKDVPDGSKVRLVSGSLFSYCYVTHATTPEHNNRIVLYSKESDFSTIKFQYENDSIVTNSKNCDIVRWLNSLKERDWGADWDNGSNPTKPEYWDAPGFLSGMGMLENSEELLNQYFNDVEVNQTDKAKVGLPWLGLQHTDKPPYTYINNIVFAEDGTYVLTYGAEGNSVSFANLNKETTLDVKAPPVTSLYGTISDFIAVMEPKPDTKVALDDDGVYYFFKVIEDSVILSADKMEESRAKELAGAVWVYGDHEPKNVNDGTKIQLSREEIVTADAPLEPETITLADIPVSDAEMEPTVSRSIFWDKTKDLYARQFTYNSKKQYQTMLEGAVTSSDPNQFNNNFRKVFEYGTTAPRNKNLLWIHPNGLTQFWNGSEWTAISGVYAEEME